MSELNQRALRHWVSPIVLAAALCALQLVASWPGELIADSREQLHQAMTRNYTDWHPPVMALVWSWLLRLSGRPASLLVLHQLLHWLGFGLIADGCLRANMRREAWLILLAGAFPLFVFYDRIVLKDVGMASALVAGAGISIWFVVQHKAVPLWALLLSALCITYGALIRTNAVFAIAPILMLYGVRGRVFSYGTIIAWSLIATLLALPLSNWVNHKLIGARAQYPVQSLQIFDLMGIAVHAEDPAVWGAQPPTMQEIRDCYTAYWWDPVSPWGVCPSLRRQIGYSTNIDSTQPQVVAETSRLWRAAILRHPVAYLVHRVEHFNASVYFFVPAYDFRYSKSAELVPFGSRSVSQRDIALDYLRVNFLCWPVFWLGLGVCALAMLGIAREGPVEVAIARLLISSGLMFSAAYFLVGVATDVRYHYWTAMSILLGVILASRELMSRIRGRKLSARFAVIGLALIVLLGYLARIADVHFT